ncbi:alpha-1,6-glucosidase domain-containing protein [Bdellovibrio sp. ZAP7]|uniref:alpha-1,6-glucosidase domain-containing protein n=1 Tax=Bdellovibrio sp. ZAP7 TaxID=2231053 RepID=UPI001FEDE5D7|nr:alpha-1,6-glucosidase domain-containing protein [Bdellovibrio sp. ZAP7]
MLDRRLKQLLTFIFTALSFLLADPASAASPARAQWLSSQKMLVKLPQGLRVADNMIFQLANSDINFRDVPRTYPLPVLQRQDNYAVVSTAGLNRQMIEDLIHRPLKVFVTNDQNQLLDSTAIQYAGLLDELYAYRGNDLGVTNQGSQFQLKLWAPTAFSVRVALFASPTAMQSDAVLVPTYQNGVWTTSVPRQYQNFYYLYEVTVYQPLTDRMETSLVTDPYSISLAMNGAKSQLVDLDSGESKPYGWDNLTKPYLNSFKDITIYELHIRDFSANDESIPFVYRGTYDAFAQGAGRGVQYLKSLADAGLTHVHLLPFNDFGSVNEDRTTWETINANSSNLQDAQGALSQIRARDAFNWGYDPVHFFVSDGSYAMDPQGLSRVRETRTMVQSLNTLGLRVVQDVVFNHTYENGLSAFSVFDKIVPLYYYRLNDEGYTYNSSCCADTASEHFMMEKLIVDSVVHWAKNYKIDGFRFDLMSFHSRSTLMKVKEALRSLTLQRDGVDGSRIYIYGEAWPFGSFYNQNPQESMSQLNAYGTGIGFFNDRLRDAVRGGTTSSSEKSDQGFATGLYFDFNQEPANQNTPTDINQQMDKIRHLGDVIKVGLAGNLRDFSFREHYGNVILGGNLLYRNSPVATSAEPIETINYVSAHDGYTLWDAVQAKAPFYTRGRIPETATAIERQRMHQLAMAIPMLSQGIPFMEAGVELLRSKNGDQDSYDSGDYFNRINWIGNDNYWGQGLPPAWKNYNDWAFWQPRLQNQDLKVTPQLIAQTANYYKGLLRLRKGSSLFKMNSLEEIMNGLVFLDNENTIDPGLIAMVLHNPKEALLIMFNSSRNPRVFSHKVLSYNWGYDPAFGPNVDPLLAQVILNRAQSQIQIPGMTTVVLRLAKGSYFTGVK